MKKKRITAILTVVILIITFVLSCINVSATGITNATDNIFTQDFPIRYMTTTVNTTDGLKRMTVDFPNQALTGKEQYTTTFPYKYYERNPSYNTYDSNTLYSAPIYEELDLQYATKYIYEYTIDREAEKQIYLYTLNEAMEVNPNIERQRVNAFRIQQNNGYSKIYANTSSLPNDKDFEIGDINSQYALDFSEYLDSDYLVSDNPLMDYLDDKYTNVENAFSTANTVGNDNVLNEGAILYWIAYNMTNNLTMIEYIEGIEKDVGLTWVMKYGTNYDDNTRRESTYSTTINRHMLSPLPNNLNQTSTINIEYMVDDFVYTKDTANGAWSNALATRCIYTGVTNVKTEITFTAYAITTSKLEYYSPELEAMYVQTAAIRLKSDEVKYTFEDSGESWTESTLSYFLDGEEPLDFSWNWINTDTGELVQSNSMYFPINITAIYIENMHISQTLTTTATDEYIELSYEFPTSRTSVTDPNKYSNQWRGDIEDFFSGANKDIYYSYDTYWFERGDFNVSTPEPWDLSQFFDGTLSVFNVNLFGGFTLGNVVVLCIAIGVVFAVLKYFAGG